MNNYKSQGQTFEEALVNLSEDGIFVEDPFFKQYMENIRKQRELGLEFDMEKVKGVVEWATEDLNYLGLPSSMVNRTLLLDMDQLIACRPDAHLAGEDPGMESLMEKARELVKKHDIKVVTSPTGRRIPAHLVMEWQMPGGKIRPIDKNTEFTLQVDGDFSKLEEMCSQDMPKPKHPLMFKITDLVEDPEEFKRLRKLLERADEVNKCMGVRKHPIFVEAIPDANIVARSATDTMSQLMSLAREFNVEIYFGTKPALKTVMYAWIYGARKKDIDLSQVAEVTVEKAREMLDKQLKVAIVGGGGSSELVKRIIAEQQGLSISVDSFDTWNFKDFAAVAKADKPARDWEHTKLRRGKGHNKFKRKGKK